MWDYVIPGMLALVAGGVILLVAWRMLHLHAGQVNAEFSARMTERLVQLQEHLGANHAALAQAVQQGLQSGRQEQNQVLQGAVLALERKFSELQSRVDSKLSETVQANRQDLAEVTHRLTKLHQATGQIISLSAGVNELHGLLKTPNLRGAFGEWTLERMLEDVLGFKDRLYHRQYTLSSGKIADAAVITRPDAQQVVCVDSKFPANQAEMLLTSELSEEQRKAALKQFARDVLGHARDIAEKYICPTETLDFAFMFVPAESIFQLLLEQRDLHDSLLRMNVIPTSPNSFYAYLQAVAFALRGLKIQENALEIEKQVHLIARDFGAFSKSYTTLGTHLDRAGSKYGETLRDIERLQQRLDDLGALDQSRPAGEPEQAGEPESAAEPEALSSER